MRRPVLFLLSVVVIFAVMYVLASALNTLHTLDVVEAQRDSWQRPAEVLQALDLKAGNTVVDLGSGAGYFALKLSPIVGSRGKVVAVDLRRLSLTFLWIRSVTRSPHNIQVKVGNEDDPHLAAASADAVLIANTYHEFGNPEIMLDHVFQALRTGGRLVIVDRAPRQDSPPGHEVPLTIVEKQIREHGFELMRMEDPFIDRPADDSWWLLVARRP